MEGFELAMTTTLVLVITYLIVWGILGNIITDSNMTLHLISAVIAIIASVIYAYFEASKW